MAKKDYSNVVLVTAKHWAGVVPTDFIRIDPIVNGKKVFINVIKWDGNVPGIMNEIYKQCGFMENHLYNNVRQELFHLRHRYYEPRKNENVFEGEIGVRMTSHHNTYYTKFEHLPAIKKVIFNDPATIVFWADDTKTVVKCQDDDIFDPEKGLAMAISKKALGNKGNYCNEFKKWLPEEVKEEPVYLDAKELSRRINEAARRIRMLNKEE